MILSNQVTGYKVGRERFTTYRDAWQRSQATGKPIRTLGPKQVWNSHFRQYVPEDDGE